MAYNTRSIKKDVDGRPIPQYFNQMTDNYEPLLGEDGAARSILWGPNGQPLSVIDNKLAVRAADLETLIGALNDSAVTNPANAASVIAALKGLLSVVGKEATLGQILSALGALATETTLGGVKTAVDVLAGTVDTQAGVQKVALSGSVAQVLDDERAAGFGQRMYYGQRVSNTLEGAGAVPIVGKTVTIWFHNLSDRSSRSGVKLHWFLGGTVHDGIPVMDFGNVPAGATLGIRIGGSAPDNDQIIHVPRFGGDGVVFSVDFQSGSTGNVRTVIMEESSYA